MHDRTPRPSTQFTSIQALRAIAALLVVVFHAYTMTDRYYSSDAVTLRRVFLGSSGVDLFFVISGFVMTTISARYFARERSVVDFLKHRALRICPLYWFYGLLMLVLYLSLPQLIASPVSDRLTLPVLFTTFTLIPTGAVPLLAQGWTLSYEIGFYVCFAVMLKFGTRQAFPRWLIAWACLIAVSFAAGMTASGNAVVQMCFDPITLEFIAGCFVALLVVRTGKRVSIVLLVAGVVGFGCAMAAIDAVSQQAIGAWRALVFGVPSLLIVWGASTLERVTAWRAPRGLAWIGDASYSIYLSHVLTLFAFAHLWTKLPFAFVGTPHLGPLLSVVAAVVVGGFSYRLIEQPLARILARIFAVPSVSAIARS